MHKIQGRNVDIKKRKKIFQKWKPYNQENFQDKWEQPAIYRNIEGADILKYEEESAMLKL